MFEIIKCTGENCANITEINKFLDQSLIINFYFTDISIDTQNYLKPVKKSIKNIYFYLTKSIYKEVTFFLKKVEINTDIGVVFSSYKEEIISQFEKQNIDVSEIKNDNVIFRLGIYSSSNTEVVNRYYLKLQEFFAVIGGIVNFFMLSIKV